MSGTRTYQAFSMAEALAAVKYDLGQDAVILNTRSFKRGGLLGLGRRTVVEVTASARDPADLASSGKGGGNVVAQKAYATGKAPAVTAVGGNSASGERRALMTAGKTTGTARSAAVQALASEADRQRTRRLAMAMQEQQRRSAAVTPVAQARAASVSGQAVQAARTAAPVSPMAAANGGSPVNIAASAGAHSNAQGGNSGNPLVVTVPSSPMAVAARRFILHSPDTVSRSFETEAGIAPRQPSIAQRPGGFDDVITLAQSPAPVPARQATPAGIVSIGAASTPTGAYANPNRPGLRHVMTTEPDAPVREELAAIKAMVGQVLQRQVATGTHRTPSMPQALFDQYLALVGHDIPEELAETIIGEVRDRLSAAELEDVSRVRRAVVEHLADCLPVSPTPLTANSPNGRPLTIALVGPTGVGKTTTLAKLAASFKLKTGRKVGQITSDTYRIAAVDQLRTYANIIGLPLQVVLTPADMRQAVHALSSPGGSGGGSASGCEVILIDTAGRSQNDTLRIAELREFIDAAHPHEVHMVLSATAGEKVLAKEAAAFGSVGVNKVILTKMDEAASLGAVVGLLKQINRPVSFITTGQEVPDHLETAKAERLAELVLGGPVHA